MTTTTNIEIHKVEPTRILAPEELNARRRRKAFTAPLDPPNHAVEPTRTGRRTVDHPGRLPIKAR